MRSCTLHNTHNFVVTSLGNGLAYILANKKEARDLIFQGDDARAFEDQLEALTTGTPMLDYEDALRVIWADYRCIVSVDDR